MFQNNTLATPPWCGRSCPPPSLRGPGVGLVIVSCMSRVIGRSMGSAFAATLVVYIGASIFSVVFVGIYLSQYPALRQGLGQQLASAPYVHPLRAATGMVGWLWRRTESGVCGR